MTQPDDAPQVLDGTDISADPQELDEVEHKPATTDPQESTDEGLGGVDGAGGAG